MEDAKSQLDQRFPGDTRWVFPAVLAAWLVIVIWGALRYEGTPVRPRDSAEDQFSAERALAFLEVLVGDNQPHHSGSQAIKEVRQRLIQEIETLGFEVTQQPCQATRADGKPVDLVNLIFRLPGARETEDKKTIAVVTHYDSREGAVGASDDGVGVAVSLEVARMLSKRDSLAHDVLFVITDGEELGMLGAQQFVEHHPLNQSIDLVINLEARGTSGPSLMFETNVDNAQAVTIFANCSPKPFGGSLFYEIYRMLPNNTDFTVFKNDGKPGFNFAYIGSVENYHTMNDTIQNLDMRSMQHHGDNLWALLTYLDGVERFRPQPDQSQFSVYFDFLGYFLVYWPVGYSIWLWLIGLGGCFLLYVLVAPGRLAESNLETETPESVAGSETKLPGIEGGLSWRRFCHGECCLLACWLNLPCTVDWLPRMRWGQVGSNQPWPWS